MELSYIKTKIQDSDLFGVRNKIKSYRFTVDGGKMITTFNKIGDKFDYSGVLCNSKKAFYLYIEEQLINDLIELREKILLYKVENLP
ncbi:hypothetical protein [Paraliobacillus sediminis]|uniref:hypothetical protein n=1 Tax=Paraliobacillus sediminis TaxID=1885916 RepID=UPI000E3CF306|nr:hypothetical protein [Paraliobacillus sediminis]